MAEAANIVLNDSVPTARTFVPSYAVGLVRFFKYAVTGEITALHPKLSLGLRTPKPGLAQKVTMKVTMPYEVTIGTETSVSKIEYIIDVVIPEDAPTLAKADALAFAKNALSNAIVVDLLDNGNFPY